MNVGEVENGDMLQKVFDDLPAFVVVMCAADNKVIYCNHIARMVFSGSTASSLAKPALERHSFDELINGKWYRISDTQMNWLDGQASRLFVGFDITDIKTTEKQVPTADEIDFMTGTLSRQAGLAHLALYLQEVRNTGTSFTACYIDINDLKYINDNFGHAEGDKYIKSVVSCIRSSIRYTDVLSRMGGDEFLLLFPNCRYEVADNIMGIITNKLNFINESESKFYSIAYGVMEVNIETPLDAEYILKAIDSKMYYMKDEYKRNRKPLPQN